MKCPECGSLNDHVLDGRLKKNNIFRRRRECFDCDHRWTTYESNNRPQELSRELKALLATMYRIIKKYYRDEFGEL